MSVFRKARAATLSALPAVALALVPGISAFLAVSVAVADVPTCEEAERTVRARGAALQQLLATDATPRLAILQAGDVSELSVAVLKGCSAYNYKIPAPCLDLTTVLQAEVTDSIEEIDGQTALIESEKERFERANRTFMRACQDKVPDTALRASMEPFWSSVGLLKEVESALRLVRNQLLGLKDNLADAPNRELETPPSHKGIITPEDRRVALVKMRQAYSGNSGEYSADGTKILSTTVSGSGLAFEERTGEFSISAILETKGRPDTRHEVTVSGPVTGFKLEPTLYLQSLDTGTFKALGLDSSVGGYGLTLSCQSACTSQGVNALTVLFDNARERNRFAEVFLPFQKAWASALEAEERRVSLLAERRARAAGQNPALLNAVFLSTDDIAVNNAQQDVVARNTGQCATDRTRMIDSLCRYQHWLIVRKDENRPLAVLTLEDRTSRKDTDHLIEFIWMSKATISEMHLTTPAGQVYKTRDCTDHRCRFGQTGQSDGTGRRTREIHSALLKGDGGQIRLQAFDEESIEIFDYTFDAVPLAALFAEDGQG